MLFTISLLGLTFSLVAWQLWKDSDKSYILGIFSFVFIVTASLSLILLGGFSIRKLGLLAVSLLSLAFISTIASGIRHLGFLKVPFLILSCVAMWKILMFFPGNQIFQDSLSIDPKAEIIVKVKHNSIQSFEAYAQSLDYIKIAPAFAPAESLETELDDYFIVNILGKPEGASPSQVQKVVNTLEKRQEVIHIELNETFEIPLLKTSTQKASEESPYLFYDPLSKDQWALAETKMNDLFKIIKKTKPENKARLFILDTGVDSSHPDLKDVFVATNPRNDKDVKGHGTHCAGIAGAMTGNSIGISSYNAEALYDVSSIKVLADFGGGTQQGIIKGMIQAVDLGADVISMSLGGRSNDKRQRAYNDAVAYAAKNNVIILAAAGNSSQNAKFYCPANSKGIITVAAVDQNLKKATFSNTIEDIEMGVSAPGVDILSTFPNGKYERFSGTSMATPFVAGLVTLMKCYKPDLSTEEAFQLLSDTGIQTQDNTIKNVVDPSSSLKELLKK